MPTKSKRQCALPLCKNLIESGSHCPIHAKYQTKRPDPRPTATERGYDRHWSAFSKWFLGRHTKCKRCGETAQVTDHITSFVKLKLDYKNTRYSELEPYHQALCQTCNKRKGKREDRA